MTDENNNQNPPEPTPQPTLPGRVDIYLNQLALRQMVEMAYGRLILRNIPPVVFTRNGKLVRVVETERGVQIEPYTKYSFKHHLDTHCNFCDITIQGEFKPRLPPDDVVMSILYLPSFSEIPPLDVVVACPIMLPDGNINLCEGYDDITKTYYCPETGLVIPSIPDQPTPEQIQAAKNIINETIIDFPFVDESSRTNMVATILTAVLRPMITGCIPAALIDKPQAGTGASLLSETVSLIATGDFASVQNAPEDDAGWRKMITSTLQEGRMVTLIDNLEHKVDIPSLAAVITSEIWSDRKLGQNIMLTFRNRLVWILNGNNVRLGGDLPRRIFWIRLNADVKQPWLRPETDFTHNQKEWIRENRGQILSAIFTLARGWIQAGRPPHVCTSPLGGFENWQQTIGGILHYAGYSGFLMNAQEMMEDVDEDATEWDNFFATLFSVLYDDQKRKYDMLPSWKKSAEQPPNMKSVTFTAGDIVNKLQEEKDAGDKPEVAVLTHNLPNILNDAYSAKKNFNTILGRSLLKNKDRVFENNLRLIKSQNKSYNKVHWELNYPQ